MLWHSVSGSILRWTEWIDGLVLHAAEDVAFYQSRRSCKEGNRELDSACSVVVGVFAVTSLILGVVSAPCSLLALLDLHRDNPQDA